MSEKDPNIWSGMAEYWLHHKLPIFTILSAFAIALWSGLRDGERWGASIFGGVVCVIIALALLVALSAAGLHQEWLSAVGIFVGFVGAERIRDATLEMWGTKKRTLINRRDE